jgi:hypothetical protein
MVGKNWKTSAESSGKSATVTPKLKTRFTEEEKHAGSTGTGGFTRFENP